VRRVLTVAVWAAVFLGAAGIGAYVAAHTDLFPPDVTRATGSGPSTATSTGGPAADGPTWTGVIRSNTYHDLYVGGRCSTRWVTKLTFHLLDGGRITGTGTAKLETDLACPFPNAQINVEEIETIVSGRWDPQGFRIRLHAGDRAPAGTADFGGFESTVLAGDSSAEMTVPLDTNRLASGSTRLEREDEQGRGTYVSFNRVSLEAA
jgi:hypothetical protein